MRTLRRTCLLALYATSLGVLPVQAQAPAAGTITGQVTDGVTLEPLSGATVQLIGTGLGGLSDAQGRFTIAGAPTGTQRVRASLIGYAAAEQSVTLAAGASSRVDFALQPVAVALEGIVAVGYGTATAKQLPSSVVEVDAEELKGITTEDVASMLQGKVAGVTVTQGSGMPGAAPQVRIRGSGSILAGGEPLYVVDGVISDTDVAQSIPVDNIASVTVLKDAAATALYGSRAANGVLVITTQTGHAGETQLRISSSIGTTDATFGEFEVMNSEQFYQFRQAMGIADPAELRARDTNWRDLAFERGTVANVNVSASGGDERTRFFVSGGYYKEDGTVLTTGFDRLSGRVNLEHAASDRLDITARAYGSYNTQLYNPGMDGVNGGILRDALNNLPYDSPYNADGSLRTGLESEWMGRERRNFLYDMAYNWSEGRGQDFGGDVVLEYELAPWLSASTTNRATFEYANREDYDDARTQSGSGIGGGLTSLNRYDNSVLTSNLLRAEREFGDHSLDGLAGFEYQRSYRDNINGVGIGLFPGLGILDVTAEPRSLTGGKHESAFASALSQINYGFLDRYFLTGSYRRDGSSRFGEDNRWGDFYSIAGAWLLSDELFLDLPAVDQLKLRASYGTTGNAEIGEYLAQSLYGYTVQYAGMPGSVAERQASPNLTWEVARTVNLGLDLGLLDRVDLSVDLYRRVNTDLLQNVEVPKTSGFNTRTLNIGSVRNQGVELSLSTLNLIGAFTWTSDFNVAFNRNQVLSLHDGNPVLNGQQRIMEGHDISTWYQRKWVGVDPDTGDPLWERLLYDANGAVTGREVTNEYNSATLQVVGTATPDFIGGMRNSFGYGPVSLSGFFTFVSGAQLYHSARERFDSDGAYTTYNNMLLRDGWSRWASPGEVATHPKIVEGGNRLSNKPSSRYLEDGSYVRLRNVTFSFTVPDRFIPRVNAGSARLYVSGDNLLTLTGFSGLDPEANLFGTVSEKYPSSRKLLVGIDLGL